ncbi:MAG: cellulase family glycosylhydrolase [Planctomycetia bacterium]|nr:cellulase family glycosylhydrolase [Planctomycetia bacterium]
MRSLFIWGMILSCSLFIGSIWAQEKDYEPFQEQPGDFAPMFPFYIDETVQDNIVNVQTWQPPIKAGSDGFLKVENGHFVNEKGTVRLLGSNLCFSGNFPPKEDAEKLAKTMARFGINIIRLHHMDSRDIWGKNFNKTQTIIDPDQLDKLDYLINQLQQNGIYININLHVSRKFNEKDGFENADQLPEHNKGLDNFEPRMIAFQKKYAKDLLTHINPYTQKAYINDPGVAMIEINNENSVVASWSWGQLDSLPEPYCSTFRELWNDWLLKKYKTTENLKKAWKCEEIPLSEEIISDGNFPKDLTLSGNPNGWELQRDSQSKADIQIVDSSEKTDSNVGNILKIDIQKMGSESWIPQLHRNGLSVQGETLYTLSFKMRAKDISKVSVGVIENHAPWSDLGFRDEIDVSDQWKDYSFSFLTVRDDPQARITFGSFGQGSVEIANVSLKTGGQIGFPTEQSLENKSIQILKRSNNSWGVTPAVYADWSLFLYDLEKNYWNEMFRYIKDELKAQQPITGTQLQYGFWYNQANLDYCDIHAYWNHPVFPKRSWDGNNWYVTNTSLANHPVNGTLGNLATLRVLNRPLTVSEYDHPYPNLYCAEGNPMICAVGAFQDWSAVYQFAWSHGSDFYRKSVSSFFDMCANPVKLVHLPACYALFVRGDIQSGPGKFQYSPEMSEEKEKSIMKESLSGYHRSLSGLKLDRSLSLAVFAGLDLTDLKVNAPKSDSTSSSLSKIQKISNWNELPESLGNPNKKWIRNEFGEIFWNFVEENAGYFQVDTPNSKLFSGFINDRTFDFDALTLIPGKTRLNWATISIVKTSEVDSNAQKKDILSSGRYLITATGFIKNRDAILIDMGGNKITTALDYGGSSGQAPVLCEGIPLQLLLKNLESNKVQLFALDQNGSRKEEIPVNQTTDQVCFQLKPEYQTLWYELIIED